MPKATFGVFFSKLNQLKSRLLGIPVFDGVNTELHKSACLRHSVQWILELSLKISLREILDISLTKLYQSYKKDALENSLNHFTGKSIEKT